MKKFNGSSWVDTPVKKFDGKSWVNANVFKWNGSNWISLNRTKKTTTWTSKWAASYNGDGTIRTDNSHLYQGYYSGINRGNQFSMCCFNTGDIKRELQGANVLGCRVYIQNLHAYYNAGMEAYVGMFYGGAKSSRVSKPAQGSKKIYFNKGQGKWVDMPELARAIRDNGVAGIYFSVNSTSQSYYGYFNSGMKIEITYEK